jgi:hypothetical protein
MRARVAGVALATSGVSDSPLESSLRTLGTRELTSLRRSRAAAGKGPPPIDASKSSRTEALRDRNSGNRSETSALSPGPKDALLLEPRPKIAP